MEKFLYLFMGEVGFVGFCLSCNFLMSFPSTMGLLLL